jgi:hypothetical protein
VFCINAQVSSRRGKGKRERDHQDLFHNHATCTPRGLKIRDSAILQSCLVVNFRYTLIIACNIIILLTVARTGEWNGLWSVPVGIC